MPLTIGTRLGPYEIVAPLGAGGMGEVYCARDTKLNRDVAIKILPEAFASDPERLARLTREAQTLASLNHPNIAAIYGLEEGPAEAGRHMRALVMELVEGETLAEKIDQCSTLKSQRSGLPLDETLAIARQIADALEAAHEQGIIHRDLKPANIKVRPDGTVKVLDFGLAKALGTAKAAPCDLGEVPDDGPHVGRPFRGAAPANSPTITTPAATLAGIILGTAAYMSPEQAAGKPVDRRSDLWAFGVVLLEMLTGRPVFPGEDVSHVLASVLKSDPDWTALPTNTPAPIRRLLRRCLEKDRKRRLDSAADARLEIDEALAPIGEASTVSVTMPGAAWQRVLPWAGAGALGVALMLVLWAPWRPAAAPPRVTRATITTSGPAALTINGIDRDLALSPDGTHVAYVGNNGTQLFVRALEALEPVAIASGGDVRGHSSRRMGPQSCSSKRRRRWAAICCSSRSTRHAA